MAFNLKTFLLDLAAIGPDVIVGVLSIKNEVANVSKTQLASDSAKLALGVTAALGHDDPAVVEAAQTAASIIDSVVQSIGVATNQNVS